VRVMAALLAVFWGCGFFGLIDLLVPLLDPEFHDVLVLETGWGLLFVVLVAVPLIAAAMRPQVALALGLQQVALVAIAVAVAAALSASPNHLIIAGGLSVTVLLIATGNARSLLLPRHLRWSWEPGTLVVAAAVPWCIYASTSASAHRDETPPIDVSWEFNHHWPVQAALAVAVILVAALAATYQSGWVVPTWCVGVCAAWIGLIAWIYPDLEASLGRPWGMAAFLWGLAFVVIMHVTAQLRTRRATTVVGDAGTAR
jgi:hypothetical protein